MAKKNGKKAASATSSLAERYLAKTTTDAYLLEADKFPIRDWIDSGNYALNVLLSGYWNRGYPTARFTQLVGPNSVGKTYLLTEALIQAQKKGYTIYMIDSEFGSDAESWIERGADPKMFIHVPMYHIKPIITEVLMFLGEIQKDDKAIVILDSVGGLSSTKETEDLEEGKNVRDMTRAQELKAMFRQLLVPAGKVGVPFWIVNHEYATMDMYSPKEQGGGSGPKYGCSIIVSMSKSKEKKSASDKTIIGTGVRCTSFKNRFAKEAGVVKVVIDFDKGLSRYSGLFPLAVELGFIQQSGSWYTIKDDSTKRRSNWFAGNAEFWEDQLKGKFGDALNKMFRYQSHTDGVFDDSELEVIETGDENAVDGAD